MTPLQSRLAFVRQIDQARGEVAAAAAAGAEAAQAQAVGSAQALAGARLPRLEMLSLAL